MMALTHGFVALAVAVLALPVLSDTLAPPLVLVAAFAGGIAPDLDLLARHRRTLHYPFGFTVLTLTLAVVTLVTGSSVVLLGTVVAGAAAIHALSDVLAGSVERAPWDPTTERAVFNHVLGSWHRPWPCHCSRP
jgi:hypothetical protein